MTLRVGNSISLQTKLGEVRVRYFQTNNKEGVVLLGNKRYPDPCPVRVQSSCLFSESFWATDCDCAAQLSESIRVIVNEGGVVVYIYEEGRGAGLRAKIEAMQLQQESGYDTKTAYECLNLDPDSRSYDAAGAVLQEILPAGMSVSLLTNNPHKEDRLRACGVNIVEVRPLICIDGRMEVQEYLLEKERVLNHKVTPFLPKKKSTSKKKT